MSRRVPSPISQYAAIASIVLMALVTGTAASTVFQSDLVVVRTNAQPAAGAADKNADKQYHRPGCPVVRDAKDVMAMTLAQAEARGYTAHPDCDPARTAQPPAQAPATGPAAAPPPAKVETVFVDDGGTQYHRKGCVKLGAHAKAVALTAVGKRWPCPVCRPPVPKRPVTPLVPGWRG